MFLELSIERELVSNAFRGVETNAFVDSVSNNNVTAVKMTRNVHTN